MPTWAPGCAAASAAAWRRLLHALRRPNLFEIWRVQFAVLPGQGRAEQSARSREQLGAVRTQELLELHLFSQIYMQDEKCSFQFRFFARLRLTNWWMSRCALAWLGPKPSARAWISFGSLSLSGAQANFSKTNVWPGKWQAASAFHLDFWVHNDRRSCQGRAGKGGSAEKAGLVNRTEGAVQGVAGGRTQWLAT